MPIPLFKVFMSKDIDKPVIDTLTSGFITQGSKVKEFETKLSEYFNYPYILTLNSATSGLTLALRLLRDKYSLEDNDEVLTTALTCTATNWPILANRLNIKWVDVDPNTCNINLDDLKSKITEKTKIIMIVHWSGYPVDIDKIKEIQDYALDKYGFIPHVIEDCAHAFGAKYKDKYIGTTGNISVFSLQAIKHLTTGDGGLIFLPDKDLYEKAKLLRWYGIDREKRSGGDFRLEPDVKEWGYKFHMNDINATIGIENLKFIDNNLSIIRDNAKYYFNMLSTINRVTTMENRTDYLPSWWIYTIKVDDKDSFMSFMKEKGIMTSQVHNRNDIHSCVKEFKTNLHLLDDLVQNIICIPVGWWVTEKDRLYIVNCIKDWSNQL